jgi:hypothetical protein
VRVVVAGGDIPTSAGGVVVVHGCTRSQPYPPAHAPVELVTPHHGPHCAASGGGRNIDAIVEDCCVRHRYLQRRGSPA